MTSMSNTCSSVAQRKKALMQLHDDAIKHCVKDLSLCSSRLHVLDDEASPFDGRESHLTRKTRGSPDLIIYNLGKRLWNGC